MSETISIPKLSLPQGLSIGYKLPLAEVTDKNGITLNSGTHYLLARNGRGKTTLLRTLAKVLKPIKGGFKCEGRCQLLSEDLCFDRELPAKVVFSSLLKKEQAKQALELADRIELDVKKPYGQLSTGNKRKVAMLMAEFSVDGDQADVLLLDEPFTGLDAFAREAFQELWAKKDDGVLRLVSCHPDFDSMEMESSLLISDGDIMHLHGNEVPRQWGDLKTKLN